SRTLSLPATVPCVPYTTLFRSHGDIMSVYTNDVDTLRQLMSQSIPQVINSVITMATTAVSMILLSPPLTVISLLMVCVMAFSARSEEHTSELQSRFDIVCRLLL